MAKKDRLLITIQTLPNELAMFADGLSLKPGHYDILNNTS